jgi:hypothetical protein
MNELVLADLKTNFSVGTITSNAHELLDFVKKGVEKYSDENYIPNEPEAKSDRAELNRIEKAIATQAQAIKTAYNAPLEEFNGLVAEIRTTIKDAVKIVDGAVKAYEEKEKKKKREEIEKYFTFKKFELVPLERIFDSRWLNKTCKMNEVKKEMDAIIAKIYQDIEVLERIPDHGTAAKAFYLESLDLGDALRQVDVIKENAEKLAREETNRAERKIEEQVNKNIASLKKEERDDAIAKRAQGCIDDMLGLPRGTTAAQSKDDIISYTLTFKGTKEQLLNLREYLSRKNIPYNKGLVLENADDARQILRNRGIAGKLYTFVYIE